MVLTLVACSDRKISDETVNVIFFTANTNASQVESYLDLVPGTIIEAPEDPTRSGFLFAGWYKDFLRSEPWDFDNDVVGETSIVLYAKWVPMLFNIIYDPNGGEMPTTDYPLTFVPGDNRVLPLPKRTGYLFVAWYTYDWEDETSTKPGDKGLQILPNNVFEDLYLYAHWKAITVVVTFRVNYPLTTGAPAAPNSKTMTYGTEIDFQELEDTALYTFMGWNSRADGTGDWYVDGEIFTRTQRITVYAIWQPK
jgi:uncharacterized repeat protein (TIGR02543 family)